MKNHRCRTWWSPLKGCGPVLLRGVALLLTLVLLAPVSAAALVSDDFNACSLDGGRWQLVDPLGDASVALVGAGTADARLQFTVPAGLSHDAWAVNTAPRLLQPVANADFVIEAKFDSPVAKKYQGQGLLVQQDANTWLRFDFYSSGAGTRIFAAAKTASGMSVKVDKAIAAGAPLYLRVARSLNTWTQSYSYDGSNWTTAVTFTQSLTVTAVGPFVGNFGSGSNAPAHTALIDYVFNLASPVDPEDGAPAPGAGILGVSITGPGQIRVTPEQASYACGTLVQLTALPDPGAGFTGWSGDLVGQGNPATLVMNGDRHVHAAFLGDTIPPAIGPLTVTAGATGAVLSWTTSEPAIWQVAYGETSGYGQTQVSNQPATSHSLSLGNLNPSTGYHYRIDVADAAGLTASTGDLAFSTLALPADPSGLVSDDFSQGALHSRWWLHDPLGDASLALIGAGTSDARLSLSVPAGPSHDPWTLDTAPRLLQNVANTDFTVELKFDSAVSARYQSQGLMVHQDNNTWLRLDFYSNGAGTRIFAAAKTPSGMSVKVDKTIPLTAASLYLRVSRSGNLWTQAYSADGGNWVTAASFSQTLNVSALGPFVGNFGTGNNAPAHTALIDYVFNAASPILPEDGSAPPALFSLGVATVGAGQVNLNPPGGSYVAGAQVQLTATADAGWTFSGWSGDLSGTVNPVVLTMNSARQVTANFVQQQLPPQISAVQVTPGSNSATVGWATDTPAGSAVDYGTTAALGLSVSAPEWVTSHSLGLSALAPGSQYFYRVRSANAAGETQTPIQTFTTSVPAGDPSGIVSDDFNQANLNTGLWTLIDPLGDAGLAVEGAGSGNARLLFSVPAGASHDPWTVNTAPRLLQAANNTDFSLETKFETQPQLRYQSQGLFIEQDGNNWLRFDFYNDGAATRIFAAGKTAGAMSTRISRVITAGAPLYLRVTRSGNQWTLSYSYDGSAWQSAGSFSQTLTVRAVGPFVGNFGSGSNAPAFTAAIDYFFNRAVPVVPEDGGSVSDVQPPLLQQLGHTVSPTGIQISWLTDEPATGQIQYGLTSALEMGTLGHPELSTAHTVNLTGLQPDTDYVYRAGSTDAAGNQSLSPLQTARTPGLSGWAPVIDLWYGDEQTFGHNGIPQPVVNLLGNVTGSSPIMQLSYALNGGALRPLTVGPDGLRLAGTGDFNIELPLAELQQGANNVLLRAIDSSGYETQRQVQVNLAGGNQWPQTYAINWAEAPSIAAVAQVVDGRWVIQPNGVRTAQIGYDRLIAIGDLAWQNYEVTVPITVHSTQYFGYNPPAVGLILRWPGHTPDGKQPAERWWPLGVFGMYRWYQTNPAFRLYDVNYQIVDPAATQLQLGVPYIFKLRARALPGPATEYKFKVWPAAQPEPTSWTISHQEGPADVSAGSLLLVAHFVDATFGNVTVVPVFD